MALYRYDGAFLGYTRPLHYLTKLYRCYTARCQTVLCRCPAILSHSFA
nr:MAG TPA: hypothetical protein [Caudoviricetes sp.]